MAPLDPDEIEKILAEEATQSSVNKPLSADMIAQLLSEEAARPTGRTGSRGPRTDPTAVREINVWFKLNHHICHPECEHRSTKPGDPNRGCWNENCLDDTRDETDRGMWVVVLVKGQWICRYCFLGGYLAG